MRRIDVRRTLAHAATSLSYRHANSEVCTFPGRATAGIEQQTLLVRRLTCMHWNRVSALLPLRRYRVVRSKIMPQFDPADGLPARTVAGNGNHLEFAVPGEWVAGISLLLAAFLIGDAEKKGRHHSP